MKYNVVIALGLLTAVFFVGLGCARAARDTSGFALREQTVVNASFEETWHAVKRALRDEGYDIYTRDKRGAFVAYTPMRRVLLTQPRRTKFTIELARSTADETAIAVESVRQVYGVTLLTHPNWHDREQRDPEASRAILDSIRAILDADSPASESFLDDAGEAAEEAPAEPRPEMEVTPLPAEHEPTIGDAETVI